MSELLDMYPRPWIYYVASGAGAGLQQFLWATPGASTYLAGCAFPYAAYETDRFLGFTPKSYCSEDESLELAMEAYCRACESLPSEQAPIGLGLTASVASLKAHRGEHRIHASVVSPHEVLQYTMTLEKGGPSFRFGDGSVADSVALMLLRASTGGMPLSDVKTVSQETLRRVFFEHPFFGWNGRRETEMPYTTDVVLLPGTFNPLHEGHRSMAVATFAASKRKPVVYMVTADSPHKPTLTVQELLARAAMFRRELHDAVGTQVLFTQGDPLYVDKASRYPGVSFVIGADALVRMLDPKWGVKPAELLREFQVLHTSFYLFGRDVDGTYLSPSDVLINHVPEQYWYLFHCMKEQWPAISSTKIREGR